MNDRTNVWNPSDPSPLPFDPATIDELERRFGGKNRLVPRASIRPAPPESPRFGEGGVDILLYVSGSSLNCGRAALALQELLREFRPEAVRLRVVDVLHDMDGAARDRVLFTPTLIFTDQQQRKTRVLGDLSNPKVLWDLLLAAGLEPT